MFIILFKKALKKLIMKNKYSFCWLNKRLHKFYCAMKYEQLYLFSFHIFNCIAI